MQIILNFLTFDFIQRALLGGIGIALIAGPLGSVIVWRRMANFGDALGHSMLLGVVLALLFDLNLYFGLFAITLFFAASIASLSYQKQIAPDALLSMLAQTALALGLILATTLKGVRIDLLEYIYGDILAVGNIDLLWIYGIVLVSGALLFWIWRPLLSITIHQDLAYVEGTQVMIVHWLFIIILAMVFAVAMKLVGVLLITALLIIPAAAARRLSKTPEQMAVFASVIGILSVIAGVEASKYADWPTGPAIVVASFIFFLITFTFGRSR